MLQKTQKENGLAYFIRKKQPSYEEHVFTLVIEKKKTSIRR